MNRLIARVRRWFWHYGMPRHWAAVDSFDNDGRIIAIVVADTSVFPFEVSKVFWRRDGNHLVGPRHVLARAR